MRARALLNTSTHEPASWLTGPVYLLMQQASGVHSPLSPLSSLASRKGARGEQWGAAADERGGKERVKGRVRKDWSVRQMEGVLSHTGGLCQHPCMVAKGTTYLSWSLFHTDSFSFHTSSASIIFFSSLWFKTASLSWADSEMKRCPEWVQPKSVCQRERKRGGSCWMVVGPSWV